MTTHLFALRAITCAAAVMLGLAPVSLSHAQPHPPSIDVLGCRWSGGGVGGFVNCINGAADRRAREAREQAERKAADARRDIEAGPRFARTLAEQRVLEAARSLHLDALFDCLQRTGTLDTLLQDVRRTADDPASLMATLDARIAQQARTVMQELAETQLREWLAQPRPPTPQQAMAMANEMTRRVSQRVPAFGCVVQHMRLQGSAFDTAAQGMNAAIDARQARFFQDRLQSVLQGALHGAMQQRMQDAVRSSAGPVATLARGGLGLLDVELDGIVNRAFVRHILLPSGRTGTERIDGYVQSLAAGAADTAARADAALASLEPDERMRAAALIDIGVSVTRDIGSKFITQEYAPLFMGGADMFELAIKLPRMLEDASGTLGVSLAGLVPEGGAATFAAVAHVLRELGRFSEFISKPPLKAVTVGLANNRWRAFMDELRDALVRDAAAPGDGAMQALRSRFPEFTGLLDLFSRELMLRIGSDYLKPLERALQERNQSTAALIRASRPR